MSGLLFAVGAFFTGGLLAMSGLVLALRRLTWGSADQVEEAYRTFVDMMLHDDEYLAHRFKEVISDV